MHTRGLQQIPQTGIWGQTARSHGRKDEAEIAPCPWNPKMASSPGGIPRARCQLQSTTRLPGQRGRLGRLGWVGWLPFSSLETAQLHKGSFQSYWLAGLLTDSPSPHGLCTEYKSSSLTGLPHKLALVTERVIQNEGSSQPGCQCPDTVIKGFQIPSSSPYKSWGFSSPAISGCCPSEKV